MESLLGYLPEAYQTPDTFLDRFLRMLSVPYLRLEREIEHVGIHFDPAAAPDDSLPWLAERLGVRDIALWPSNGLRALLCERLYRRRGTLSALARMLCLYLGLPSGLLERHRLTAPPRLMDGYDLLILLPPPPDGTDTPDTAALTRLVTDYLPDGVNWRMVSLPRRAGLGQLWLGLNTSLSARGGAGELPIPLG